MDSTPVTTIGKCFDVLSEGQVDYAVVPFENSTNGQVVFTYDLLRDWHLPRNNGKSAKFSIVAEQFVAIHHCLLLRASSLEDIHTVYSHPQVWGQVTEFMRESPLRNAQRQNTNSTAEAALVVAADTSNTSACICSRICSKICDLPVVSENIEDIKGNTTRFLVLGYKDIPAADLLLGFLTSIMFVLNHNDPGALVTALDSFKMSNVNLTSIASRPSGLSKWQYVFFVEAEGAAGDEAMNNSITHLSGVCTHVVVLGSFVRDPRYWN